MRARKQVGDVVCVGAAAEAAELSHLAAFGPACQPSARTPAVRAHHSAAEPQSRLLVASQQRHMRFHMRFHMLCARVLVCVSLGFSIILITAFHAWQPKIKVNPGGFAIKSAFHVIINNRYPIRVPCTHYWRLCASL